LASALEEGGKETGDRLLLRAKREATEVFICRELEDANRWVSEDGVDEGLGEFVELVIGEDKIGELGEEVEVRREERERCNSALSVSRLSWGLDSI
jgi:hypothetical protein